MDDAVYLLGDGHVHTQAPGQSPDLGGGLDPLDDLAQLLEGALVESPPVAATEGGLFRPGYDDELDRLVRALLILDPGLERSSQFVHSLIGHPMAQRRMLILLAFAKAKTVAQQRRRMSPQAKSELRSWPSFET